MKVLPACQTCVKSGFLCTNCQEKLDLDELSEFELDLARDLLELEEQEKYAFLRDTSLYKAIDYEDVVIIIVGNKDKIRITPELIQYIKKNYEIDEIILIEHTKKPRPVIEDLIAPGKLISLNELFLATGDVEFKAIIRKEDKEKILFTSEELEGLVKELTSQTIRIEYE
ncbi:MAG: hypothetical protein EU535_08190 [Promethearchaeota archaeon]|nr:MAG: hypothetical protein EU535_08190 [Candidatus Lokiarchaeota archaeon]